jgi:hypothetical protein
MEDADEAVVATVDVVDAEAAEVAMTADGAVMMMLESLITFFDEVK